jgi:hypothetical protein
MQEYEYDDDEDTRKMLNPYPYPYVFGDPKPKAKLLRNFMIFLGVLFFCFLFWAGVVYAIHSFAN